MVTDGTSCKTVLLSFYLKTTSICWLACLRVLIAKITKVGGGISYTCNSTSPVMFARATHQCKS